MHYNTEIPIYADSNRYQVLTSLGLPFSDYINDMHPSSVLYLGSYNTFNNKIISLNNNNSEEYAPISNVTYDKNEIYNNGGSQVYN